MLWKKHLATVGLCSLLIACGPDCVSECERAQADGDCLQKADGKDRDCDGYCEDLESLADSDNGDCEDELDAVVSCVSDEDNACKALEGTCADESNDLANCIGNYCNKNPNNSSCRDVILD